MSNIILHKISRTNQYLISIGLTVVVAVLCYALSGLIGYKIVALILLVTVSLTAMFFDIAPVLCASVLSALIWDYFFIPPKFTLFIANAEDLLMFSMYFIIAMVNAALTFKIRAIEKIATQKEGEENTLKLYNTLLNSLSHELRTPIATILGATDNLQSNNSNLTVTNKADLLAEISTASLRLNRQVENLLNMSRLDSGVIQPNIDWCDVNELVHDTVNRLKENLPQRIVNIEIEDALPLCKLDVGLMEQVLTNLILNANIYCPTHCIITIKATFTHNTLVLIVADNGNGFADEELPKVFDKFYRVPNTNTNGSGLGLSIVKGFVEAHNGTIILHNSPTGGAVFTISIPTEIMHINTIENE
ncbi:MAG: ATP-binding protein [Bacteroidia bacterium]